MTTADPPAGGSPVQTGYAPVNGLSMYYEIHGDGRPLVLLHGAYITAGMFGELLPGLAATRQVIAPSGLDLSAPRRMPAPGCDCAGLRLGLLCMCVVREKLWQ
jgi:hypothetical protein